MEGEKVNLAGKCQGIFHCHSLSAWSTHDTVVAAVVVVVLALVVMIAKK